MLTAYHLWCAESCSRNATGQWSFASILQTGSYHHYHSHFTDGILRSRVQQPAKATQAVLKPYIAAQEIWLQGVCVSSPDYAGLSPRRRKSEAPKGFFSVWAWFSEIVIQEALEGSESPVTLALENWMPSSGVQGHLHLCAHTYIYTYTSTWLNT